MNALINLSQRHQFVGVCKDHSQGHDKKKKFGHKKLLSCRLKADEVEAMPTSGLFHLQNDRLHYKRVTSLQLPLHHLTLQQNVAA